MNISRTASVLKKLLLICTDKLSFFFQGQGCQQLDGVTISSTLGPVLEDIFTARLERKLSSRLWKFNYCRYVDDILVHFDDLNEANNLFIYLNALHKDIGFKMEDESDHNLIDSSL